MASHVLYRSCWVQGPVVKALTDGAVDFAAEDGVMISYHRRGTVSWGAVASRGHAPQGKPLRSVHILGSFVDIRGL